MFLENIKNAVQQVTGDPNGFGVAITFTPPGGSPVTVYGMHTKHHLKVNEVGVPVNGKNASVSVSEGLLVAKSYPVRNGQNEVAMVGHLADAKDSTGTLCNYIIRETFPDETIGHIVFILGDYQP